MHNPFRAKGVGVDPSEIRPAKPVGVTVAVGSLGEMCGSRVTVTVGRNTLPRT
jgi:hypothetical protein